MAIDFSDMMSNNIELATSCRWLAVLDIKKLFTDKNTYNTKLNLTSFTLPEIILNTAETNYYGKRIEIPSHVEETDNNIIFDYFVDAKFSQYQLLHEWFRKIVDICGTGSGGSGYSLENVTIPINVYGLSGYNTPIFCCKFNECYIKSFGSLTWDYGDDDNPLRHTFTCSYLNYDMFFADDMKNW